MDDKLFLKFFLPLLFFTFGTTNIILSQSSFRTIVAVMPLRQNGFETSDIDYIVNLVSAVFVNTGKYKVLERWQIESILAEQKINLSGCVDDECAIEVGKLLSAHMVVTGYLYNKAGRKSYEVYGALKLIDVTTSEIIRIVDIKIRGDYSKLIDYIKNKAYILANKEKPVLKHIPKYVFKFSSYVSLGTIAYFGYQFKNSYQGYKKATDKYDMLTQKKKAKENYKYMQYSGIAFGTSVILYWISKHLFSESSFVVLNYQEGLGNSQIKVAINLKL